MKQKNSKHIVMLENYYASTTGSYWCRSGWVSYKIVPFRISSNLDEIRNATVLFRSGVPFRSGFHPYPFYLDSKLGFLSMVLL